MSNNRRNKENLPRVTMSTFTAVQLGWFRFWDLLRSAAAATFPHQWGSAREQIRNTNNVATHTRKDLRRDIWLLLISRFVDMILMI